MHDQLKIGTLAGVLRQAEVSHEEFANALQRGGYATDPDYASKLLSVVDRVDELQGRAGRPEIAGDVKPFKPEAQPPIATPRTNNA